VKSTGEWRPDGPFVEIGFDEIVSVDIEHVIEDRLSVEEDRGVTG
jgi:hypothetical protein